MRHRPKPLLLAGGLHSSEPARGSPKPHVTGRSLATCGLAPASPDQQRNLSQGVARSPAMALLQRPSHLNWLRLLKPSRFKFFVCRGIEPEKSPTFPDPLFDDPPRSTCVSSTISTFCRPRQA